MSYEGYIQRLCESGHLTESDVYMDYDGDGNDPMTCPHNTCQKPFAFVHHVDETNGIEYDNNGIPCPYTVGFPFEEYGWTDNWHEDHYGNKYATKRIIYKIPE